MRRQILKKARKKKRDNSRTNNLRKRKDRPEVAVLLSGGIDSTACVAFYLNQGFSVTAIFIDYGQAAAKKEKKAANLIAEFYKISLLELRLQGAYKKGGGVIIGRNAFCLITALMELKNMPDILAIGIHSGTGYEDCTQFFVNIVQRVIDIYLIGKVQIGAPFINWNKSDILLFCRSNDIPLDLTYSCELGLKQPCGRCLSCRDLEMYR